ncbi:hypothetical protein ACFQ1R_11385 [Mariniflexile jejuense]|uniref:Uncharacterized protein n=1 Tax=Mariniflexile jejuense TaxID=1173582 RepID=A0ABW3JKR3_9FLAO
MKNELMEYKWNPFDAGNSIGTIGSENGKILKDEENPFGARITLEENGSIAPFSITVGIYGLMFHTDFYSSLENAEKEFQTFKAKVEKVIEHYSIDENKRDSEWNEKHNQLMELLTE